MWMDVHAHYLCDFRKKILKAAGCKCSCAEFLNDHKICGEFGQDKH